MKKKALIIALVLAAALAGGVWWYTSQPAAVEGPGPADDAAAVDAGADEPEPSEPEVPEEAPEPEEEHYGERFYNEETGLFEPVDGSGSAAGELGSEDRTEEEPDDRQEEETEDQQQNDESDQQQQQTWEEIWKKMQEAGMNPEQGLGDQWEGSNTDTDGSIINW